MYVAKAENLLFFYKIFYEGRQFKHSFDVLVEGIESQIYGRKEMVYYFSNVFRDVEFVHEGDTVARRADRTSCLQSYRTLPIEVRNWNRNYC